jgi:sugar O-acyltransferase (sialic acid O-acetyltransferase NeuD family)
MNKSSIIGFGELGQQFFSFLKEENLRFDIFDDNYQSNNDTISCHKFGDYLNNNYNNFYIALGYNFLVKKDEIIKSLIKENKSTPTFTHKTSFVNASAKIEEAVFIYPMCNIDKNVTINKGTLINNSVTISHDTKIGRCSYISPGVVISGFVEIGNYTFIGTGSIISNGVKIGNNVIIGIGSVVTSDVPDNLSVIGNPMKILNKRIVLK